MEMFRVLEFLKIRDSKNMLLWKQVSSFSQRNYFQCVTFLSSELQCYHLQCEKRTWKMKQWGKCVCVSECMSKMRSYFMCTCVTKRELAVTVCKMYTTRNFTEVWLQKVCLHMYTQQCACIPFLFVLSACFCKC